MHLLGADQRRASEAPDVSTVDRERVLADGATARDRKVAAEYDRLAEHYAAALGDELDGKPFDRWLLDRLADEAYGGRDWMWDADPATLLGTSPSAVSP